jgi:hypothetical protein
VRWATSWLVICSLCADLLLADKQQRTLW